MPWQSSSQAPADPGRAAPLPDRQPAGNLNGGAQRSEVAARRFERGVMVERKAVLITGASSGIGEVTARELARRGFRVFAGVRSAADGARLTDTIGGRCTPISLDVTEPASIAAAAAALRAAGGVYGLVNNAGIAVAAPLEFLPLDELRRQFEVNVFGALAVTQALLPQLRRSLGRIVNVGSIAGRAALPIAGPYGASKAALDSLTQSLRMELEPFEVRVSYIEPGAHRTPIWERGRRGAERLRARLPPLAVDYYGGAIDGVSALMNAAERRAGDPLRVAQAIARALEAEHPKQRYAVGRDTRVRFVLGLTPPALKEWLIMRRLRGAVTARDPRPSPGS
jgi:NAD(P)-dependent dehydrogenase (short-subunit alcohol dehydrogenase family)